MNLVHRFLLLSLAALGVTVALAAAPPPDAGTGAREQIAW